ncbi:MAG TPA: hypothetical protein VFD32_22025 [Dehalococcoidia bacterium]|nr:hypothetical protein [Dehalococcoidia bacterium]
MQLRDRQGDFYLITPETLQVSRVAADQLPALQRVADEEVAGYLFTSPVQIESLPGGQHTAGLAGPTFIVGPIGLNGRLNATDQNEATPH